jgi:hypothetical protein
VGTHGVSTSSVRWHSSSRSTGRVSPGRYRVHTECKVLLLSTFVSAIYFGDCPFRAFGNIAVSVRFCLSPFSSSPSTVGARAMRLESAGETYSAIRQAIPARFWRLAGAVSSRPMRPWPFGSRPTWCVLSRNGGSFIRLRIPRLGSCPGGQPRGRFVRIGG